MIDTAYNFNLLLTFRGINLTEMLVSGVPPASQRTQRSKNSLAFLAHNMQVGSTLHVSHGNVAHDTRALEQNSPPRPDRRGSKL